VGSGAATHLYMCDLEANKPGRTSATLCARRKPATSADSG
jgi:hypothetical protein